MGGPSSNGKVHAFASREVAAGTGCLIGTRRFWLLLVMLLAVGGAGSVQAQTNLPIPNGSFESPETVFAEPLIDSWERTPKPGWFVEEPPVALWTNLTGVFLNPVSGDPDHIGNIDGNQAMFLFAVPEVGVFQDYNSIGGTNTVPSNEFDAPFQVGKSYRLTVGVIGGGGGMTEGASLGLGLYYRDAASNRVSVAMTNVAYTPAAFPNMTNLIDISVTTPPVAAGDAWAGKFIGVELISTVGFSYTNGGYWDLDHVRLTEFIAPRLTEPMRTEAQFEFTLLSDPGAAVGILTSTNLSEPMGGWTLWGVVTNVTGTTNLTDSAAGFAQRFYQARQLP